MVGKQEAFLVLIPERRKQASGRKCALSAIYGAPIEDRSPDSVNALCGEILIMWAELEVTRPASRPTRAHASVFQRFQVRMKCYIMRAERIDSEKVM